MENQDMEKICWYVAKIHAQSGKKIKKELIDLDVECFLPYRSVIVEVNGRKVKKEKPLVLNYLFLHASKKLCFHLANDKGIKLIFIRNVETHQLLAVPDKQMQNFMFLVDFSEEAVKIDNNAHLKSGDRVRVIKGEFAGIEGELVRIQGHKRVVVRLEGLFSLVTTYIPSNFLETL